MARNLQSKLSPTDSVRIFDLNKGAMEKLAQEMKASQAGGASVELATNTADAARDAVSHNLRCHPDKHSARLYDDLVVLSMI